MGSDVHRGKISINFEKISFFVNFTLPLLTGVCLFLGIYHSIPFLDILGFIFGFLTLLNFYARRVQTKHALLRNFGIVAYVRYLVESVGPEFRQYLFMSDTEEKPFNRIERSEVYRKSKGIDSSSSFGSLKNYDENELKLRHSMFPIDKNEVKKFSLTFGEERGIDQTFSINHPVMISAMSFGSLGKNAVRALSRGARKANIAVNTGEGGFPKYHLLEEPSVIFQMGTAKFGVRNDDSSLNEELLKKLSNEEHVKMIEIKLSQGAKPGKGGILPKEKISDEIAGLRNVKKGKDVISPPFHVECRDTKSTVEFIKRVQDISGLPVGIKLCLGKESEFTSFVNEMKDQNTFPDYIAIDGAEGGTGAAPKSFMDDVGIPIFKSLPIIHLILKKAGVRDRLKLIAAGKLVSPGRQFFALSLGADAIYSARGFMLALGCIQALQCNNNTCPVGITSHNQDLQRGLDIEDKAQRVYNYVKSLQKEHTEIMAALGVQDFSELTDEHIFFNQGLSSTPVKN